MILVVIVHADPSVRSQYVEALNARGIDAEVLCVVGRGAGLSSIYVQLAAQAKVAGGGSALRGLLKLYPPKRPIGDYDHIVMATFSAGYAFARALTAVDVASLAGLVLLDSGHTEHDRDGTASDAGVAWAVAWASAARAWRKLLWIGHSDVDPMTYASTTEFAEEVVRLSGEPLDELTVKADELARGVVRKREDGLFHVRAHNVSKVFVTDQMAEHRAALNEKERGGWGPTFVAEALSRLQGVPRATQPPIPSPFIGALLTPFAGLWAAVTGLFRPKGPPPLGERLVAWLLAEEAKRIVEIPGPKHHPAIQAYLAGTRRGGTPTSGFFADRSGGPTLGDKAPDETEWCIAGRCAGVAAVLANGDHPPHGYRAACWEAIQDAKALGTWHDVSSDYEPQVGDCWMLPRAGSDPRIPYGKGHACTQIAPYVDGKTTTLGGNEGNTWTRTPRRRSDAVGWISTR
jgi:hypothetical protein